MTTHHLNQDVPLDVLCSQVQLSDINQSLRAGNGLSQLIQRNSRGYQPIEILWRTWTKFCVTPQIPELKELKRDLISVLISEKETSLSEEQLTLIESMEEKSPAIKQFLEHLVGQFSKGSYSNHQALFIRTIFSILYHLSVSTDAWDFLLSLLRWKQSMLEVIAKVIVSLTKQVNQEEAMNTLLTLRLIDHQACIPRKDYICCLLLNYIDQIKQMLPEKDLRQIEEWFNHPHQNETLPQMDAQPTAALLNSLRSILSLQQEEKLVTEYCDINQKWREDLRKHIRGMCDEEILEPLVTMLEIILKKCRQDCLRNNQNLHSLITEADFFPRLVDEIEIAVKSFPFFHQNPEFAKKVIASTLFLVIADICCLQLLAYHHLKENNCRLSYSRKVKRTDVATVPKDYPSFIIEIIELFLSLVPYDSKELRLYLYDMIPCCPFKDYLDYRLKPPPWLKAHSLGKELVQIRCRKELCFFLGSIFYQEISMEADTNHRRCIRSDRSELILYFLLHAERNVFPHLCDEFFAFLVNAIHHRIRDEVDYLGLMYILAVTELGIINQVLNHLRLKDNSGNPSDPKDASLFFYTFPSDYQPVLLAIMQKSVCIDLSVDPKIAERVEQAIEVTSFILFLAENFEFTDRSDHFQIDWTDYMFVERMATNPFYEK